MNEFVVGVDGSDHGRDADDASQLRDGGPVHPDEHRQGDPRDDRGDLEPRCSSRVPGRAGMR